MREPHRDRRSIRLPCHDYSAQGAYFLTLCLKERVSLFGEVDNGEMRLNEIGRFVEREWANVVRAYEGVTMDALVVMPDHVHGIVVIDNVVDRADVGAIHESPSRETGRRKMTISRLVGRFKTVTGKWIDSMRGTPGLAVWQRDCHDRIIRDEAEHQRIREYIAASPSRWSVVGDDHESPQIWDQPSIGFHVQGDRLLDASGVPFVMRGVNHGHVWFPERMDESLDAIAATGANCVRLVLSNGGQWRRVPGQELANLLDGCRRRGLVAIPEVHDCTGWGEKSDARPLSEAVDYWLSPDIREAMAGTESTCILNIANEPIGNGVGDDIYVSENIQAIRRSREAGIRHCIMIDGANWGQDWERTMFARADDILAADPLGNIVFSVHMYEHYGTEEIVRAYLDRFNGRLPLVVGEFAADHGTNGDVDEHSILRLTHENGQGCLGWSWKGNMSPLEGLDIARTWDGELSPWGRTLVESEFGVRATSRKASVFDSRGI